MEWDGTRSDDGGGAGGVALDWVFTVEGGARVRVCRDGRGVMRGGRNELGWVRIGESLTHIFLDGVRGFMFLQHTSAWRYCNSK